MTFKQFLAQFDHPNSTILLEGKRKVLDSDKDKLTRLGKLLATKSCKMTFRSGNADGADYFFSLGVSSVDKSRLQVITPFAGHRQKENQADSTVSLDEINIASEPEVVYQSKQNKKTNNLIDKYVSGEINRFTIKAAYIIRDTIKVIGTTAIKPTTVGVFYEDLIQPMQGGTGHTINICIQNNIPVLDQSVWFNWLAE